MEKNMNYNNLEEKEEFLRENFVQLHNHTNYSLLDGAVDIKKMVERAKVNGQKALAITDHGNLFGLLKFQKECKKQGIKPILGCEVYVAPNSRFDRESSINKDDDLFVNARYHHLVLLVKNEIGYKNLNKLVSLSYKEGFYYKPRVDLELLDKYSEGLIASSACLGGAVPQAYLRNAEVLNPGVICPKGYEFAKNVALQYKNIFGDDFYLELQDHSIYDQKITNPVLLKLSKELDIPFIITNDTHYVNKEDAEMHDVLLRIQIGARIDDDVKMEFETDEFYLKSYDEMRDFFSSDIYDEGFLNTGKIAEQCNFEIKLGEYHLPVYDIPEGFKDSSDYLKYLSEKGLVERFGEDVGDEYKDRLEHELQIIKDMGFCDYFLIVWDFIKYAKDNDIPVGPGRGSAAGSLVSYTLGIIDLDPLEYDLLFERFLNPERVSMPDIDIDFCQDRRQEVIDYVYDKYGHDKVANIVTFGTLSAKSAIRDVARVYNFKEAGKEKFPPSFLTKLLKKYGTETIDEIVEVDSKVRDLIEEDKDFRKIIEIAKQIEGFPRHASTHAAGVIIGGSDLNNHIGTFVNKGTHTTQFDMKELEEMGLLKMDFLGLRNLTIIKNAVTEINERKKLEYMKYCEENNIEFKEENVDYLDMSEIPEDDKKTFDLISSGNTGGVFQVESPGMQEVLKGLKPQNIEEITACISLYRPGPMDNIPTYIDNKNNPESISYKHPLLKEILETTYGVIVYQEQVMRIFQDLGGFSLGRADVVRRAMSKKEMETMKKEEEIFIYGLRDENNELVLDEEGKPLIPGAMSKGVSPEVASKIVKEMEAFASYAFNKSHASAYAKITYETAYLKANYPLEYAASLLTSVIGSDTDRVNDYLNEVENNMKINVKAPNIQVSNEVFTVDGDSIYYGLTAIKDVGSKFAHNLKIEREKSGEFKSFFDFVYRMCDKDLNRASLIALIKAGALDDFGNRNSLHLNAENFLAEAKEQKEKYGKVNNLFEALDGVDYQREREPEFIEIEEMDEALLLADEFDVLSFYASSHPFDLYFMDERIYDVKDVLEFENTKINNIFTMAQIISRRDIKTKNNDDMAFVQLANKDGDTIDGVLFPDDYYANRSTLNYAESSNIYYIYGNLDIRHGEKQFIIKQMFIPAREKEEFDRVVSSSRIKLRKPTKRKRKKVKYKKGFYFKVNDLKDYKEVAMATKDYYKPGNIEMFIYCFNEKRLVKIDGGVDLSFIEHMKTKYPKQTLFIS